VADIAAQNRGENQKQNGLAVPCGIYQLVYHCIPLTCQPTAIYARLAEAQGGKFVRTIAETAN